MENSYTNNRSIYFTAFQSEPVYLTLTSAIMDA